MRWSLKALLAVSLAVVGCSSPGGSFPNEPAVVDAEAADVAELLRRSDARLDGDGAVLADVRSGDLRGEWVFDRAAYEPVHGWILLDADPAAVHQTIEMAAQYGVNHIQLSHGLIMNIEDILGDDEASLQRVETLNLGIGLAHERGMKVYVWSHEFSGTDFEICYGPKGEVWAQRGEAYRQAFQLLPALDGIILMYGSAPAPPWFSLCMCEWCLDNYDDLPLFIPPNDERLRLITEHVGEVVVNELGRELFVRTFVHEPAEIAWHGEGLMAASGVEFTGMHKGPVQDWQPYNPHHPNMGNIGNHPSVMELDLAGEYYGLSELPFCAPGYYWYRMNHLWQSKGIGVVARIQRGSHHAIGTPNEVNLLAVRRLLEDHSTPLEAIWDEFIEDYFGLAPTSEGQASLKQVLMDTFPIRRKSHYALGIWALEKGSDLPADTKLGEFNDRGKMPQWDPDWQDIWDRLDKPDRATVLQLHQEGSEAVDLAQSSLARFPDFAGQLEAGIATDLERQLQHQYLAARAWRAVDLFIWCRRAGMGGTDFPERKGWQRWAFEELEATKAEMESLALEAVTVASPGRMEQFAEAVAGTVPQDVEAVQPAGLFFSPLTSRRTGPGAFELTFIASHGVAVDVDYGLEMPDYGSVLSAGEVEAGAETTVELGGLEPDRRYVVRLRAKWEGTEQVGGDFWLFTH